MNSANSNILVVRFQRIVYQSYETIDAGHKHDVLMEFRSSNRCEHPLSFRRFLSHAGSNWTFIQPHVSLWTVNSHTKQQYTLGEVWNEMRCRGDTADMIDRATKRLRRIKEHELSLTS